MRESELKRFVMHIREFFMSFESMHFKLCRAGHIQKLEAHVLSVPALLSDYSKKLKNLK